MTTPLRHVIASQGGKHGVGGTFLQGQEMPSALAEQMPKGICSGEKPVPEAPAILPPAAKPAAPAPPQALPSTMRPEEPQEEEETPQIPTTKKELARVKDRAEILRICKSIGLAVADGEDEFMLREKLAKSLSLK